MAESFKSKDGEGFTTLTDLVNTLSIVEDFTF